MKKNLKSYVKTYNFLSAEDCDQIVEELKKLSFLPHTFVNYNGTRETVGNDPLYINSNNMPMSQEIIDKILKAYWNSLENYIIRDLNFPWWNGWNGYTPPKFNKYTVGSEMKTHCDHITDIFDGDVKGVPVLTMLVLLNDDFDGGELELFDDTLYEFKKGQIVIFPSNFMYPHRIKPISRGERYSMVSWVL